MKTDLLLRTEDAELPELPEDATRYVVAANGTFCERRTSMFATSTRIVGPPPRLGEHYQYCRLTCGKINRTLHAAMLAFFLHANRLHGGEAALVLLYDLPRRMFRWYCPRQTVEIITNGSQCWTTDQIEFHEPVAPPEGCVTFGDAHLHPGPPHPSDIDARDDQDGLHIIVGNIEREMKYHIDFVMDGVRFGVRESQIFDDPACRPCARPPRGWLEQVFITTKQVPPPKQTWQKKTNNNRWGRA